MRQIDRQRERSLQTDGSLVALFNLFVQIARDQLHIVVAMSPIGDSFRNRIRKFPALVNCCTIDWLQVPTNIFLHSTDFICEYNLIILLFILQGMARGRTCSRCKEIFI